jgi:putative membrane protein
VRCLSLALLLIAPLARAHSVQAESAAAALPRWGAEPWVLALLALSLGLYLAGAWRLWQRSRGGRSALLRHAGLFAAGWLTLAGALASPLVRLPWQWLTAPLVSWLLHAVALWAWHVPRLFEGALASSTMHGWQHTSFLASALLFWWAVLGDGAERPHRGGAMLYLFTTMLHTGALGALLTWSAVPWYPAYAGSVGLYGYDLLEDQQLGGLIMWIPGALAYLFAGLALAARWLRSEPRLAR